MLSPRLVGSGIGEEGEKAVQGIGMTKKDSRHVAFWGKCQVIRPNECYLEDDQRGINDYFSQESATKSKHRRNGSKGSILQLPFRSSKSTGRRWSNVSSNENGTSRSASSGSNTIAKLNNSPLSLARPSSAPIRAPSLSPTLPISRDGSAHKLRQKLISPPPPTPIDDGNSPIFSSPKSINEHDTFANINEGEYPQDPASPQTPLTPLPLARPVAVRKPLMFGFDKEDDDQEDARANVQSISQVLALRVPPIIYAPGISKKAINESTMAKTQTTTITTAAAILDWEEAEERSSSNDEGEGTEEEETPLSTGLFDEEDLHGECNCANCEPKMMAALSPNYSPSWTRSARRKYLADRKEAMNEQSRKAVRPPIWLKSEDSEIAAENSSSPKVRDIKADEIDAKHDRSQTETIARKSDADDHIGENAIKRDSVDDPILRKEVEEEVRLREEENRLKKTRNEMRRLSCDVGSGLRVGGGGARAMMRQLEEAEQAERRAKIERSRSPRTVTNEEQGSPKETRPPLRIASPTVDLANIVKRQTSPPHLNEKFSRTPSPLKRILSNTVGKSSSGATSPSSAEAVPARHPSPSLLIKRELSLGIPVQSNTVNHSIRSRQPFAGNLGTDNRIRAGSVNAIDSRTSSPKYLPAFDDGKQHVSADDVSMNTLSLTKSAGSIPYRNTPNMGRSFSSSGATKLSNGNLKTSSDVVEGDRPTNNLRRSNTTGSRVIQPPQPLTLQTSNTTNSARMGQYGSSPLSADQFGSINHQNNNSSVQIVEARIDKARSKAKSSFKDLMARMKS